MSKGEEEREREVRKDPKMKQGRRKRGWHGGRGCVWLEKMKTIKTKVCWTECKEARECCGRPKRGNDGAWRRVQNEGAALKPHYFHASSTATSSASLLTET